MYRVGIVPFEIKGDQISLLFVTSQTRGRWIPPKGRRKASETSIEACHREGFEEAGVRGAVLDDFPITIVANKKTPRGLQDVAVTYYPYLVQEQAETWPEKKRRQRQWASLEDAAKIVPRDGYLALIKQFETLLPWIKRAASKHKTKSRSKSRVRTKPSPKAKQKSKARSKS